MTHGRVSEKAVFFKASGLSGWGLFLVSSQENFYFPQDGMPVLVSQGHMRGFIKSQALGKLTGSDDDFAWLV